MSNKNNQADTDEENKSQKRRGGPGGRGPMGGGAPEKAKNLKGTWGRLLGYSKSYLPMIVASLILAAIGSIISVIGPGKIKVMVKLIANGVTIGDDGLLGTIDIAAVVEIAMMLVVLYAACLVCRFIGNVLMAISTQKIAGNLRSDIGSKINRLPFSYFDKVSFGDVLSRVTNDADTIGQSMNQSMDTLVMSVTMLVGAVAMMFYYQWTLAIAAIASSLLGFTLMAVIMMKSQKQFVRQQRDLGEINGHIEEVYSGHNVVKVYNGEKAAKAEFDDINKRLETSGRKAEFLSGLMGPLMGFVGNLGYVTVCIVGAILVANNKTNIETIIAFFIYVRLFTNPLSQIAQAFQGFQRAAAAGERVFEFLSEKELSCEKDKPALLENVRGDVEFRNVRFGYLPEKTIINDFSAIVKAGQKVAIVGPTGAGKTTMVNLLMRFYELDGGEILIDNVPIQEVRRENVHDQFCMVLQDTWLFEGTIRDNIIYSKAGVTNEQVEAACKAVGLHHFVNTLPNGYDTVLSDKANLSQGQRQLVTIARAVIQNAPMLILDEATSSVDTRTEVLIQEAMDRLMEGRTSFVIAHRLSTIKNADMILVMRDGDIIERGTHAELLSQKSFYADLYNSQFEQA